MAELFSVVIPLYNKSQSILDTVRSVLAQDFHEFEIIIVDDGSSDDGPQKIERELNDPRIRVIRQENSGEGAARNTGISAARYDFIAPLDADDVWLPGYLSRIENAIAEFPSAGMICCGGVARNPDDSGYLRQSKLYRTNPKEVCFFSAPFFFGNASSIVFRKELASIVGGFPVGMKQQADVVFFFKLALLTQVVFCPALLSIYNIGLPEQISVDRQANLAATVESSNQIYEFWASHDIRLRDPTCIAAVVANLRAAIRLSLASSNYGLVSYFLENTDRHLLQRLTTAERLLYPRPRLRRAAIAVNRLSELRRKVSSPSARYCNNVMAAISDDGSAAQTGGN